jgi:dTDP-4-amino-4,6-dideoxygalactose transaminase
MSKNRPKRLFLSPPHMSGEEIRLVKDAFDTNYIAPLGPMVDAFEKEFSEYTGIPYCVALSSGTAATHLALRHLGVGPGDEVLASTLTFIGSVSPVTFLGGTPVFIDSDRATWNMDPNLLDAELKCASKRGRLPKAVIPTDLYGACCDLPTIKRICDRYEVPVICDSAEAMGSRYRGQKSKVRSQKTEWFHAGVGAWAAVYSFNGNKIMTTSGGGMLASEDRKLIEHARKLSQQARDPAPHYEHSEIGYNYRMSNILAAIGEGQIRVLDQRVRRKREIFETYRSLLGDLPGIEFMPEPVYCRSNRWLTVILVNTDEFGGSPESLSTALEAENIEARPVWKPMHLQPVFKGARVRGGAVAEDLFSRGLCLPSGTAMTRADTERVCNIARNRG